MSRAIIALKYVIILKFVSSFSKQISSNTVILLSYFLKDLILLGM